MSTGKRKYDVLAVMALVLGLLAIASFRSEFRLHSTMPPEFFDAKRVAGEKRASEESIAELTGTARSRKCSGGTAMPTAYPSSRRRNSR